MDLVSNIKKMYTQGDGHVHLLAASIRHLEHLLFSFALGVDLATVPSKVLQQWADNSKAVPGQDYVYRALDQNGKPLQLWNSSLIWMKIGTSLTSIMQLPRLVFRSLSRTTRAL